jgi:hypothetical protein
MTTTISIVITTSIAAFCVVWMQGWFPFVIMGIAGFLAYANAKVHERRRLAVGAILCVGVLFCWMSVVDFAHLSMRYGWDVVIEDHLRFATRKGDVRLTNGDSVSGHEAFLNFAVCAVLWLSTCAALVFRFGSRFLPQGVTARTRP